MENLKRLSIIGALIISSYAMAQENQSSPKKTEKMGTVEKAARGYAEFSVRFFSEVGDTIARQVAPHLNIKVPPRKDEAQRNEEYKKEAKDVMDVIVPVTKGVHTSTQNILNGKEPNVTLEVKRELIKQKIDNQPIPDEYKILLKKTTHQMTEKQLDVLIHSQKSR